MKKNLLFICFLSIFPFAFGQRTTEWGDLGNGTYRNPVLPADYSDIDAIRVGSDYYAISSTFQYSPGVVILHSKDLVNWRILSHVIDDVTVMGDNFNWDKMSRYGRGVWAGSIRYYKDKFWIYFGTPDEGFFMSSASDPAGPWEPLHQLWSVKGWDDCCTHYDDDGQIYFVATHFADGYKSYMFKLSEDGKSIITEEGKDIKDSGKLLTHMQSKGREASKLFKINGHYYHFYSEVEDGGRRMMMGRSDNIYGPYETKQINRVKVPGLDDREPNQGGLIELPDKSWWFFTHHGSGQWDGRPASLLPVTWIDGWPIIGSVGADGIGQMAWAGTMPLPSDKSCFIQTNDEFSDSKPALQWEWNYQPRADKWSLSERPGFLRLKAFRPVSSGGGILFRAGNTITQRSMKTEYCEAVTKIHIDEMADGQVAGICHYGGTYSTFGIKQVDGVRYIAYDNNGTETVGEAITDDVIYLRSAWTFDGINQYSYSTDGNTFTPFGSKYGMTWGNYRGDRIGIFTYNESGENGLIDVDWFHYDYNGKDPGIEPIDPGLENLSHQWTFDDGTSNDMIGTAHGILQGGAVVENGSLKLQSAGQYLDIPASVLGINTYSELSMEGWFESEAGANTGNTMLCYFGDVINSVGANGCFISVARKDDNSRTAISCGNTTTPWNAESYVNAAEMDDGNLHHVVSVITDSDITFYIDGLNVGMTNLRSGNSLSNIAPNYAFLGKSGYSSDPTWLGSINKFSIYKKALSEGEIKFLYQNGGSSTSIAGNTFYNGVTIYPNPASNMIFYKTDENIENGEFTLCTISGKVIFSKKILNNSQGQFDISSLHAGLYIVKIRDNTRNYASLAVKN